MTSTVDGFAVPAEAGTNVPGARVTRLVRNPYLTVVQCTEDEVLLRHGSRSRYSKVLRDEGRRRVLGPLLRAFARPTPVDDVVDALADRTDREGLDQLVAQLTDEGALVDENSGMFCVYRGLTGGEGVAALERTTVGVLGLGQLGTQVGTQLATLGVGRVFGLDDRAGAHAAGEQMVTLAQRFQERARREGLSAVEAVDGSLDADDDQPGDAVAGVIGDSDLVVLALEGFRPAVLHRVNRLAVAAGTPWLPVYADGSELLVGPLVVPGQSPCFNEHEIQHESSRVLRHEFLLYSEELARHGLADLPPLLPPFAAIAASWAVVGALPFLVDGSSFLVGRVVRIDFERLEITQEHVMRLPRCPVCTERRHSFRHPFL